MHYHNEQKLEPNQILVLCYVGGDFVKLEGAYPYRTWFLSEAHSFSFEQAELYIKTFPDLNSHSRILTLISFPKPE